MQTQKVKCTAKCPTYIFLIIITSVAVLCSIIPILSQEIDGAIVGGIGILLFGGILLGELLYYRNFSIEIEQDTITTTSMIGKKKQHQMQDFMEWDNLAEGRGVGGYQLTFSTGKVKIHSYLKNFHEFEKVLFSKDIGKASICVSRTGTVSELKYIPGQSPRYVMHVQLEKPVGEKEKVKCWCTKRYVEKKLQLKEGQIISFHLDSHKRIVKKSIMVK